MGDNTQELIAALKQLAAYDSSRMSRTEYAIALAWQIAALDGRKRDKVGIVLNDTRLIGKRLVRALYEAVK